MPSERELDLMVVHGFADWNTTAFKRRGLKEICALSGLSFSTMDGVNFVPDAWKIVEGALWCVEASLSNGMNKDKRINYAHLYGILDAHDECLLGLYEVTEGGKHEVELSTFYYEWLLGSTTRRDTPETVAYVREKRKPERRPRDGTPASRAADEIMRRRNDPIPT